MKKSLLENFCSSIIILLSKHKIINIIFCIIINDILFLVVKKEKSLRQNNIDHLMVFVEKIKQMKRQLNFYNTQTKINNFHRIFLNNEVILYKCMLFF